MLDSDEYASGTKPLQAQVCTLLCICYNSARCAASCAAVLCRCCPMLLLLLSNAATALCSSPHIPAVICCQQEPLLTSCCISWHKQAVKNGVELLLHTATAQERTTPTTTNNITEGGVGASANRYPRTLLSTALRHTVLPGPIETPK